MTIEEVHKLFLIPEDVSARGKRRVPPYIQSINNKQFLVIFFDEWNKQDLRRLYGTWVSGCNSKDMLPILT